MNRVVRGFLRGEGASQQRHGALGEEEGLSDRGWTAS